MKGGVGFFNLREGVKMKRIALITLFLLFGAFVGTSFGLEVTLFGPPLPRMLREKRGFCFFRSIAERLGEILTTSRIGGANSRGRGEQGSKQTRRSATSKLALRAKERGVLGRCS